MMTHSKCVVFSSAFLMTFFTFGILAENNGDNVFPDTKDPIDFSKTDSQNSWSGAGYIDDVIAGYQPEKLNTFDGLSQNMDDDLDRLQESEYVNFDKKGSSFVRIGKLYPMNRFIRIGRINAESNFDDLKYSDIDYDEKRASSFVRIGKAPSSFVRIGKAPSNFVRIGKAPSNFVRIGKAPSNFVRIGKSESDDIHNDFDKRASSFVRIGKAPSNFVRIGKVPSNFVRIGKAPSSFVRIGKAPSSFVRIGRSEQSFDAADDVSGRIKRESQFDRTSRGPSNFVRIGKAPSSFVRIGKAPSSFVRIGKAPSSFVRIGKAPSSFVRIGKAPSSFVRIGKAPSSFVRIGKADINTPEKSLEVNYPDMSNKRASSFLRIGKSSLSDSLFSQSESSVREAGESPNEQKRVSSFVRIGKSLLPEDNSEGKRASSFVRIGKLQSTNGDISGLNKDLNFALFEKLHPSDNSQSSSFNPADPTTTSSEIMKDGNSPTSDETIKISTRGSAFVRIGKIPSSAFVRIGKNTEEIIDEDDYNRRSRGNQSSFVRIGK